MKETHPIEYIKRDNHKASIHVCTLYLLIYQIRLPLSYDRYESITIVFISINLEQNSLEHTLIITYQIFLFSRSNEYLVTCKIIVCIFTYPTLEYCVNAILSSDASSVLATSPLFASA
jgi:hypothetical protein